MEEIIKSRQNPRVKMLAKLQERSGRRNLGRFVVEGLREIERAFEAGAPIEELYFCEELFKSSAHKNFLESVSKKIPTCALAEGVFEKVSNREGCDGLIAVSLQWGITLEDIEFSNKMPKLILVADSIEKPGNLGALLRSADAVKVDAVILSDSVVDVFNPAVVRASQGAMFSMQIANATFNDCVKFLSQQNIKTIAMSLNAKEIIWDSDLSGDIAIVVGSEKDGLSQKWINACDKELKYPMYGGADSLNVNVAASLALYEKRRIDYSR